MDLGDKDMVALNISEQLELKRNVEMEQKEIFSHNTKNVKLDKKITKKNEYIICSSKTNLYLININKDKDKIVDSMNHLFSDGIHGLRNLERLEYLQYISELNIAIVASYHSNKFALVKVVKLSIYIKICVNLSISYTQ